MKIAPLLVFGCALCANASTLRFTSEIVHLDVTAKDTVCVVGEYRFVSSDPNGRSYLIPYPFPVDSVLDYPDSIRVWQRTGQRVLPYKHQPPCVLFEVAFERPGACTVTVFYRQHVRSESARYILTTTGTWGNPLDSSTLLVSSRPGIEVTSITMTADSAYTRNGATWFEIRRAAFMPTQDLGVCWRSLDAQPGRSARTRHRR